MLHTKIHYTQVYYQNRHTDPHVMKKQQNTYMHIPYDIKNVHSYHVYGEFSLV